MRLTGVIPPMVTPVTGRVGTVDQSVAQSFSTFLVEGGVHGLFPCGSIGEFSSLTRGQRKKMIETVVAHSGDLPVLAGCGGTSFRQVSQYIQDAADGGADAVVAVTPYYLDTTEEGLIDFFELLADDAPLPVVLYNIPPLTGQHLSVEAVTKLAEHKNIIGIKDSSGDFTYHYDLNEHTPQRFSVVQGSSELAVASLDIGSDGLVLGPSNVFPEKHADLYNSYRQGDRQQAVEIINTVTNPVVSATNHLPTAAALKHLLHRAGHDIGEVLIPLPRLTAAEKQRLDECYDRVSNVPRTEGLP